MGVLGVASCRANDVEAGRSFEVARPVTSAGFVDYVTALTQSLTFAQPIKLMQQALKNSLAATALMGLSLYLWRIAYIFSDWAVLALAPLALAIAVGLWPLTLDPWRAKLHLCLREESPLRKIMTGNIRATFLTATFTFVAVTLLAWLALNASLAQSGLMIAAFLLAAWIFSAGQHLFSRHFHQPFARSWATSIVTWMVALPLTLIIAISTWVWATQPGAMWDAEFLNGLQIGFDKLPTRGGWIADILAVPYGYEAAKLWVVVQLREYPIFGALFSLDAALFSFVLCRSAIVMTHFIEAHIMKTLE